MKNPHSPDAPAQLLAGFKHPRADYSFAPFWFWNDALDKRELARQLREIKRKGNDQVVVHARLGLRVDYLSERWFDCVTHTIACAKKIGIKLWLYDENNWPSGCAGGKVLERYPQGRSRHMVLHKCTGRELATLPMTFAPQGELVAALMVSPDGRRVREVTGLVRYAQVNFDLPGPDWTLYFIVQRLDARCHPLALPYQTDCLDPAVIDTYLELTHDEYFRRFGPEFGRTILGFFTDEPGLYYNLYNQQPGSLPWTGDLLEYFKDKRGYDLTPRLPWLWEPGPLSARTRQDFWQTVTERFCEVFFVKQRRWCDAHGVQMIGHLEWEEYLSTHIQFLGELPAPMRHLHMAGLDRIDEDYHKLTEKYASSVQHTTPGLKRTMSESFALTGWDVTLEKLRAIINWQYVRGVNFIVPHAFFYSLRGARVNDAPPSLFFQNTFWPWFKQLSDYAKRLGYMMTQGEFQAPFAVYYPIHAARRRYDPARVPGPAQLHHTRVLESCTQELDRVLLEVTEQIEQMQSDFDIVDDQALARARFDGEALRIGPQAYRAFVAVEWNDVPSPLQRRLLNWARRGGLLVVVQLPGSPPLPPGLTHDLRVIACAPAGLKAVIRRHGLRLVHLTPPQPHIRVMRRAVGPDTLLMLNNEASQPALCTLREPGAGDAFVCDCQHGSWERIALQGRGRATQFTLRLEPQTAAAVLLTAQRLASESELYCAEPPGQTLAELGGRWQLQIGGSVLRTALKTWGQLGWPRFSGTAVYQKSFVLRAAQARPPLWLDLGQVHEIAEVYVDGQRAGCSLWPPRRVLLPPLGPGQHRLTVHVTNTPANALEQKDYPSGLLGPVRVLTREGRL